MLGSPCWLCWPPGLGHLSCLAAGAQLCTPSLGPCPHLWTHTLRSYKSFQSVGLWPLTHGCAHWALQCWCRLTGLVIHGRFSCCWHPDLSCTLISQLLAPQARSPDGLWSPLRSLACGLSRATVTGTTGAWVQWPIIPLQLLAFTFTHSGLKLLACRLVPSYLPDPVTCPQTLQHPQVGQRVELHRKRGEDLVTG